VPRNDPSYAKELLTRLQVAEDTPVTLADGERTLIDALLHRLDITDVSRTFLGAYARYANHSDLQALLEATKKADLRAFAEGRQIIDVVLAYPVRGLSATEVVGLFRPLQPRLYSIASSLLAHPDQAHLTIGVTRYESLGRVREGVCSTYVADRVCLDDRVPIYPQPNPRFRLPESPDTAIIMIGPGTGVAPFRAFLQERQAVGAKGRNWLFFGEQRRRSDFLYQSDWERWQRDGLLTRVDLAFSRDQDEKIYVQHLMRERAHDVFSWLQAGAHVYVCGDAKAMASDVHQALIDVARDGGGLSAEAATEYVDTLRREHRYHRDVY
jgi:sulfite reductase (NADPH) flavoprotein alpha-component